MITVFNNQRVKDLAKLSQKKYRQEQNCFLVEGLRFVEEALQSNAKILSVIISPKLGKSERGTKIEATLRQGDWELIEVSDEVMTRVADTKTPQGVAAVIAMKEPNPNPLEKKTGFWVLIDGIQDPGNLGTIIRTSHGAGANGVIITSGTVDIYNPKTVRATMGSLLHLPVEIIDADRIIDLAKANSIPLICADLNSQTTLSELKLPNPCILILGSEAYGPSEKVRYAADFTFTIPMPGGSESLNVAVAGGIIIYEAVRQNIY